MQVLLSCWRSASMRVHGSPYRANARHQSAAGWILSGVALGLLALSLGGCRQLANPIAEVELQQSLYDLQDLIAGMQDDMMQLQGSVDSLQRVVAVQDSVLRRVANLAGMPQPAPLP